MSSLFESGGLSKAVDGIFGRLTITPAGTLTEQQAAAAASPPPPNGDQVQAPIVQPGIRAATSGANYPTWCYVVGGLAIIAGAFYLLRK